MSGFAIFPIVSDVPKEVLGIFAEGTVGFRETELLPFEDGAVAYDHRDAAGFIKLNALRLRTLGARKNRKG